MNMSNIRIFVLLCAFGVLCGTPNIAAQALSDRLAKETLDSPEKLLQGRVSGINVTAADSDPMAAINVHIRGINALRGTSEPLWIVNGIMLNSTSIETDKGFWNYDFDYHSLQNSLRSINPMDIESIEVLKDLSATAIYGSRGANGVIIIKTKQGVAKKKAYTYFHTDVSLGITKKPFEMLDPGEWLDYRRSLTGSAPDYKRPVDWQDEARRLAVSNNNYLSLGGSVGSSQYYMSVGTKLLNGVMPGTSGQQYNISLNMDTPLAKWFRVKTNVLLAYGSNDIGQNANRVGSSTTTLSMLTSVPFRDFEGENYATWRNHYQDKSSEYRVLPDVSLLFNIHKTLKLTIFGGVDYRSKSRDRWIGRLLDNGAPYNSIASAGMMTRLGYNTSVQLDFSRHFGKHLLEASLGGELHGSKRFTNVAVGNDFFNDKLQADGIQMATNFAPIHQFRRNWSTWSVLGRVKYEFNDIVSLDVSLRSDKTVRIDRKSTLYPGAQLELDIRRLAGITGAVSRLSVSGGWGRAGMQTIEPYDMTRYYCAAPYPEYSDSEAPGYTMLWRTKSDEYNAGFDLGLFGNHLTLATRYYNKETDDRLSILKSKNSVFSTGGSLRNRGVEATLEGIILKEKKLRWSAGLVVAYNRNEVLTNDYAYGLSIGTVAGENLPSNISMAGHAVGSFYGLRSQGIVKADNLLMTPPFYGNKLVEGDVKFIDTTHDYRIDNADKTIIGNPIPKVTGGLHTTFEYGNFHVDMTFSGAFGHDILNLNDLYLRNTSAEGNILADTYRKAYSPTHTDTNHPRLGAVGTDLISSRLVQDGSYIKLANINVAYTFRMKKSSWIKTLRLNASANNLFTITGYDGWSPEVNSFADDVTRLGIDYGSYPSYRTIILGLSATF